MGLGQGHTHVLRLCSAYELGTEWCPWAGDRTVPMGWGQNGAHMLAGESAEPGLCPCA